MRPELPQEPAAGKPVTDVIADALARRIVLGQLLPGQRVGQDQVAAEFGASHVPVREAFRRLEARGLLVSEPRRGVRVAPIDPAAVREVTEMRAALEGLALRHAAPHLTVADFEQARLAIRDAENSNDAIILEQANRRFHRILVEPCGMRRLLATIDDLHQSSARYLLATWKDLDWQPRSETEHRGIVEALEQGRQEEAATMLESHIRDAGAALVAALGKAIA